MTSAVPEGIAAAAPGLAVVRVMICDDSAVVRAALARMLDGDPAIRVVAHAANGRIAVAEVTRQKALGQRIDVVVLDIEMPEMDGLTALPLLLGVDPLVAVIMASTLTTRGADVAMRALRMGAADYLPKPSSLSGVLGETRFRDDLLLKIKGLARQRQATRQPASPPPRASSLRAAAILPPRLLAVGSSTGGPQALLSFFEALGGDLPLPVVLTQHMPASFLPVLAEHISRLGAMPCAVAQDGARLLPGRITLAAGDRHLLVENRPGGLVGRLADTQPENFCRPAVDPMLRSAADACGGRVLAVILTGMGQDGLGGTEAVIAAGGTALAQDEATSVVWGMPGAVAQAGLCHAVQPIGALARLARALIGVGRR